MLGKLKKRTFYFDKKFKYITLFAAVCFLNSHLLQAQIINEFPFPLSDASLETASEIRYQYPDSAKVLLKKAYTNYLEKKDSVSAVSALLKLADISGTNANYADAYDAFWKALLLADKLNNDQLKATIYRRLGRFYSYYKKNVKAIEYLNDALSINKNLRQKGQIESYQLVSNYYAFAKTYRELGGQPQIAEAYIDSCQALYPESNKLLDKNYLSFEQAAILLEKNKYDDALKLFQSIEPWFLKNDPSYLVLLYKYWGDTYFKLSNISKSEDYYLNALKFSVDYNSHIDFTPLIYNALTSLYLSKNNYNKAFYYQQQAKALDTRFFDSRSTINRSLLEIRDEFRLEKEHQEKIIQAQQLKELEQEEKIYSLKIIMLSIAIVSVLLIGFFYFYYLRSKHKTEKQLIRKNKALKIKKAQELLELKNKELAVSALQLIEKDEFLNTLKSKVRGSDEGIKTHEVNKVLRSISISNNQSWEEFKLRFIKVNESFYKEVSDKFPNLSQNDQKMCALIKLNFSSKEMARLLGISPESVHTKRYRLRKKMGLSQGTNLEDFIASL